MGQERHLSKAGKLIGGRSVRMVSEMQGDRTFPKKKAGRGKVLMYEQRAPGGSQTRAVDVASLGQPFGGRSVPKVS